MMDQEQKSFKLNVFQAYEDYFLQISHLFPPSANVDILLLLLGLKTSLRSVLAKPKDELKSLKDWTAKNELFYRLINKDAIYITSDKKYLDYLIRVDFQITSHEFQLGDLLGYPKCCCEKIAVIGESNIDSYENWLISQSFLDSFKLINPYYYRQGRAFISHVPCSTSCESSLMIANKLKIFILSHKDKKIFQPWVEVLCQ